MATTNRCLRCNHTWHPRGRVVSHACPACRSNDVAFVPPPKRNYTPLLIAMGVLFGVGLLIVVGVIALVASPFATGDGARSSGPTEPATISAPATADTGTSGAPKAAGKPAAASPAPKGPAPVTAPAVGPCGGGCQCGDGSCGCCGRGCCSHHGGVR